MTLCLIRQFTEQEKKLMEINSEFHKRVGCDKMKKLLQEKLLINIRSKIIQAVFFFCNA